MKFGKIEKGVELPKATSKYPFPDMEIGDSVHIEAGDDSVVHLYGRVKTYANMWGKRHNAKFKIRGNGNSVRVWRTE